MAVALFQRLLRTRVVAEGVARTDPLTGLQNRRAMEEALDQAVSLAGRHGTPFSGLMIDINRFKAVNDMYATTQATPSSDLSQRR